MSSTRPKVVEAHAGIEAAWDLILLVGYTIQDTRSEVFGRPSVVVEIDICRGTVSFGKVRIGTGHSQSAEKYSGLGEHVSWLERTACEWMGHTRGPHLEPYIPRHGGEGDKRLSPESRSLGASGIVNIW